MGKYAEDAKQLLHLVGGKENIAAVSHCMTRMRFALADPEKADVKAIEAMKVVKGSFTQSGQFQVIIGNTVADFYNDFVKEAGIEGVSKEAVRQAAKKNQNVLQRIVTALAEIFAPLIRFDRAKIKAAGHPDVTVCIITEEGNAEAVQFYTGMQVTEKETVIADFQTKQAV